MVFLIIFLVLIVTIIAVFLISYKFYKSACKVVDQSIYKSYEKKNMSYDDRVVSANVEWLKEQDYKDFYIKSNDGLKLHGIFLSAPNAYRTIICVHGYRGSYETDFSAIIKYFHGNHSNILLIEQRGHGESQGDYITFGAKESEDLKLWINYILTKVDVKNPVYLYGISMGSSTCLLSLKDKLPFQVKGVIADCGYTSMEYEIKYLCKEWYHLPAFPFVNIVKMYCKLFAGFNPDDTNVVAALKDNEIPILFIHGDADKFVIPENTRINYTATKSPKEVCWISGADHAESIFKDPIKYHNKLEYFFNTYK